MADDILVPQSDSEMFLATMTGDYTGELPVPYSRVEKYLAKILDQGGVIPEDLTPIVRMIQANTDAISALDDRVDQIDTATITNEQIDTLFS